MTNNPGTIKLFNQDGTPANDVIQIVKLIGGVPSPAGGFIAPDADSSGTVTTVSVVTANGLAGSVANAGTTPAITLRTTVTGLLKGNGTAISAASPGTDYLSPTGNGSGLTNLTAANIAAGTAGINISGNAATATALQTARTIAGHSFDGTANITIIASDVGAVPTSTTVNGHALSSNVVISASDITTGTVPVAQLPLATTSDFGAVKPDGVTITISGGVISAAGGGGPAYIASSGTATAAGVNSLSAGPNASSAGNNGVALGNTALADANHGVAVGDHSHAISIQDTAIGASSTANNTSTATGNSCSATGANSFSGGFGNTASHAGAVILGSNLSSAGANEIRVGNSTQDIGMDTSGNVRVTGGTTGTAAAGAGTLLNMPTAAAGNPTLYAQVSYNGTIYTLPLWPHA